MKMHQIGKSIKIKLAEVSFSFQILHPTTNLHQSSGLTTDPVTDSAS